MEPKKVLDPTHPALTGDEANAAVQNQLIYYPQVVRSQTDTPVSKQHMGLISFMMLAEPRQTKDGKKILGFFKLRGNWSDLEQAESKGARIIREEDSRYKIRVVDVGVWLPLCDDDSLVKKNVNINLNATDDERHREDAARAEESKRRQIMREIKEREIEVKSGKDYNDDEADLNFYTLKRVTWMRMRENLESLENQRNSISKKLIETREKIRELDDKFPDHKDNWLDLYNTERRKAGIPDYTPSQKEQVEFEN